MTDWESLSEQLKALGVALGKDKAFGPSKKAVHPIESVVEGQFIDAIYGQTFVHEEVYTKDYFHGENQIFPTRPINALCSWARAENLNLENLNNFIFLDTETSGLAGGTGTYAFEVGLGRFTEEGFHLAQFFMRHPGEEAALLAGMVQFMDGMEAVVTYNGKSFDIPLLNTRYTLSGLSSPFEGIYHFDLLSLARRLWRIRLESRTLGNIEKEILNFKRGEEEVPGYMIPEMYFEYLKTKDARPMAGIFYHNAMDILSLAALFSHSAAILEAPFSNIVTHGEDLVALARHYENLDETELAEKLYQKALASPLSEDLHWDTLKRFSLMLKRQSHWQKALPLWEEAAANDQLYAFVELAKYYEHQTRAFEEAQQWTLSAMTALEKQYLPAYQYQVWQEELSHRLARLENSPLFVYD